MTSTDFFPQISALSPQEVLAELGFHAASLVQTQAFPILLNQQSLRLVAPTGCGKTLSYLIPLMSKLNAEVKATQLLVVVPTRELAHQVAREARKVAEVLAQQGATALRISLVSGGENSQAQKTELQKSPHVVVATPGRIHDLIDRDHFEPMDLSAFVVDEFDMLLGMGFTEPLERVLQLLPKGVQLCFLSATSSDEPLPLENFLPSDVMRVVLGKNSGAMFSHLDSENSEQSTNDLTKPNANDEHLILRVADDSEQTKFKKLLETLQGSYADLESGLIFCQTKDTTHALAAYLQENGLSADALSGDLGQIQRNTVLRRFRAKGFKFLVTTNVLSRGIDLQNLGISINFDLPASAAEYLHRAGRTGRAGNAIKVMTLVPSKEETNFRNQMAETKINFKNTVTSFDGAAEQTKKTDNSFNLIHLNRGKSHKIRPGDILGGLLQKGGLEASDVGSIFIYDHFTHVEINAQKITATLQKMEGARIKNLSVKASIAAGV